MATGYCAMSTLVCLFTGNDVIKRHPKGIPLEGCAHAQPEVAEYSIKRHP